MSDRPEAAARPRSPAEWVSLGVALLLLALVVGVVIRLWMSPAQDAARFKVERGPVRRDGGQYYLPFTLVNEGDETASQVTIEGTLDNGGEEEKASTTFDFVPRHSEAEGVLIFTSDPEQAELRVVSFQKP